MPKFKKPRVTVDAVMVDCGRVLLIKRANAPFKGRWALPGGFVENGETVETACVREAKEETGLEVAIIRLVGVYSDPKRDPRGHTVGIVFLCRPVGGALRADDDAKEAAWFAMKGLPGLSFDHGKIIDDVKRLLAGR